MPRLYTVILNIPEDSVQTILDLVKGEAEFVSMTPTETNTPRTRKPKGSRNMQYLDTGKTARQLILDRLKSAPASNRDIVKLLVANNYSKNTHSGQLHSLKKEKLIELMSNGMYRIVA